MSSTPSPLSLAASPYLARQGDQPVRWYSWGEEAFARARELDRPVFLSIGYASCHWCRRMEVESFADADVAALLNDRFVPIKVDRQERPDVDALYTQALLEIQGDAGWPANLFLMQDLRPFTGATYLPPVASDTRPALRDVLQNVADLWETDRQELLGAADALRRRLYVPPEAGPTPEAAGYRRAVSTLVSIHDDEHGGFGTGAKFPHSPELELLLLGGVDDVVGADDALRASLLAMDHGGLQDHLGGGFHRYCIERSWTIPRFEKLLPDNAQLALLYARASSYLTRHGRDAADEVRGAIRVVRDTMAYLLADLRHPAGGFHAGEAASPDDDDDAAFYAFTADDARRILRTDELPYGIRVDGNLGDGRSVLTTRSGIPDATVRARMLSWRDRRPRPAKDTQRIVAWNAMAASALAEAGRLFANDEWIAVATATLAQLLAMGRGKRALDSDAPVTLDDVVFLADACLAVHQARPDEPRWLLQAAELADEALRRFGEHGGACYTAEVRDDLFVRRKELTDGSEPSGNGRLADVLRQLEAYGLPYGARLDAILQEAAGTMREYAAATPELWAVARARTADPRKGPIQLVIAGDPADRRVKLMLRVWNRSWRPQGVVIVAGPDAPREKIPLLRDKPPAPDGTPLAYVCRQGRCDFPVASVDDLGKLLG